MKKTSNESTVHSTDGLAISYSSYGRSADVVIFIHAWCCDSTCWDRQITFFSKAHTVITIDLGGHGRSGRSRDKWTIPMLANDVVTVLDQFTFQQVAIVGHSLGGMVALLAASKLPKSKKVKVVLVDILLNKFWPEEQGAVDRMLAPFKKNFKRKMKQWVRSSMFIPASKEALITLISDQMAKASPSVALPLFRDLMTRDYSPSIRQLRKRKMTMHLLNADTESTDEKALIKLGFTISYLPGTGHFMMLERPIKFNRQLLELIRHA